MDGWVQLPANCFLSRNVESRLLLGRGLDIITKHPCSLKL
jgi:hypothetical protein